MLAAAPEGRLILMSTPWIASGFFYTIGITPMAGNDLNSNQPIVRE
jgi:hypothetical protein